MKSVDGNTGVKLLDCTNPVKNEWRIRWDVQEYEKGKALYMEEKFDHRPTEEEIRSVIMTWYNGQTQTDIISGFSYRNVPVWLSSENQFNYKSAYDLAVQTGGATLPVTFKFGTDTEPQYRTFETLEELTDFYKKLVEHIQKTQTEGWKKKDAFDLERYRVE